MIKIYTSNAYLLLEYTPESGLAWVLEKMRVEGEICLRRTFTFEPKDFLNEETHELMTSRKLIPEVGEDDSLFGIEGDSVVFILGVLDGEYLRIEPGKVTHHNRIFLKSTIKFEPKFFVSVRNINVFAKLERFINNDIYVGGESPSAIPEVIMWDLIKRFPTTRQKDLYEASVITGIIRDYVDNVPDYRAKYEKHINKKSTVQTSDLRPILRDQELHKFQLILSKLETMLANQETYSENQWQEEILAIITLIYPKYVHAFKSVQLKRPQQTDLYVDILLIDSSGYVDIIEIKKPFESVIITAGTYRDNHIPYRELTGTIMQIEKYIYHLNRWGADGEKFLTQKLSGLPSDFEIKLTSPGGLVIMGRDNNLTLDQKRDFEVVKRKYKNIMDILTYDELIRRLKFMIKLWINQPEVEN